MIKFDEKLTSLVLSRDSREIMENWVDYAINDGESSQDLFECGAELMLRASKHKEEIFGVKVPMTTDILIFLSKDLETLMDKIKKVSPKYW